ncbi:DUF5050 domain-containing protein [Vallitalea guaymasensis]|uniref:DUF5050 domain-containing protein n=1 Tax=Vallitalea guaymasensis TaxID=1185412 RepID=UPI00272A6BBC|nr:DUF5050 domain-containing protein [Vallitalea guaymasensis]
MTKKLLLSIAIFMMVCYTSIMVNAASDTQEAKYVQQQGEWIYYIDDTDEGYLCKIKMDGTGYTKLFTFKASEFLIKDEWIYYIESKSIYLGEGALYRIRSNGTGKEKLFSHNIWDVKNLAYSNGYLTFYAGKMYKMDLSNLSPIELNWNHSQCATQNGYLISSHYGTFSLYNLATDKDTFFKYTKKVSEFVCDDQWIYFIEKNSQDYLYDIVKVKYDGSERTIVLSNLKNAGNLQLFNGELYYYARTDIEYRKYYYGIWKTTIEGQDTELVTKDSIYHEKKFENVIDNNIYFTKSNYLAVYDIKAKKINYKPLEGLVSSNQSAAFNDTGNLIITRENEIIELTPDLKEIKTLKDFTVLDNREYHFGESSRLYYYNNYVVIQDRGTSITDLASLEIVNLKKNTIYTLKGEEYDYFMAGIDNNYVYFFGEKNDDYISKLFRLPIGELDISKKEHIWDVRECYYFNGYVIDQGDYPTYELRKLDLSSLKESKISSVFIYGCDIKNGYLYYVKGNNGGIYKTSINNINVKKIYSQKQWASDVIVNKSTIFFETWKGGNQLVSTDTNGNNFKVISCDSVSNFFDANEQYVVFNASRKFACYLRQEDKIELISDFDNNPKPASVQGSSVFYDVSDNDWFASKLYKLHNKKIISGHNGYFSPNKTITVDQFIKTLCVALNGEIASPSSDYWAQKYIDFAIDKKYISANQFDDYSREITRGELAQIIVNTMNLSPLNEKQKKEMIEKIKDYKSINDAHKEAVLKVYHEGIITGYDDGSFKADNTLKRSEASIVIYRIVDSVEI